MSKSRNPRQNETVSVHTAGLHMAEVGEEKEQDLLLDGDSSFGVKLQLQPSVSV